jgi:hypothetical protein
MDRRLQWPRHMTSYESQKMAQHDDKGESKLSEDFRQSSDALRLPLQVRYTRLLEAGYTIDEITKATSQAQEIRRLREQSLKEKDLSRFQAAKMNSVRTIKGLASVRLFSSSQTYRNSSKQHIDCVQ